MAQTGAATASVEPLAQKFNYSVDDPIRGDNTDDDEGDDINEDEDDGIFPSAPMISSTVTASNDYSGIDVGLTADSVLSPSSSFETLPSMIQQPGTTIQTPSSLPSSEEEYPLSEIVEAPPQSSAEETVVAAVRQGDIGGFSDPGELPPVAFLARLLCSEFLLTGFVSGLLPDHQVRVSVKALALSCLGHLIDLYPQLIAMNLHKTSSEPGNRLLF